MYICNKIHCKTLKKATDYNYPIYQIYKLSIMKNFYSLAAAALLLPASAMATEGLNFEGTTMLFDKNISEYHATDFRNTHVSLAACGDALVLNFGDGTTPIVLNPQTGEKLGEINLGSADASGSVASDCAGNMLICNFSASGSTFKVWKTSSATAEPVEIISLDHNTSLDLGARLHVQGDINGDAQIVATMTGLYAKHIYRWTVTGGVIGDPELVALEGVGEWYQGSSNAKAIAHSAKPADGYYVGHYQSGVDEFYFVNGETLTATNFVKEDGSSNWAFAPNAGDSRAFNGRNYTAVLELSYFTGWAISSYAYIYDTTDPTALTGSIAENALKEIEMTVHEAVEGANAAEMVLDANCNPTDDVLLFPYGDNLLAYFVTTSDLDLVGYAIPAAGSGVNDAVAAKSLRAYGTKGAIVVENNGATVEVFNAAGAAVARTRDSQINVAPGLYIVKVAGNSQKVLVK